MDDKLKAKLIAALDAAEASAKLRNDLANFLGIG